MPGANPPPPPFWPPSRPWRLWLRLNRVLRRRCRCPLCAVSQTPCSRRPTMQVAADYTDDFGNRGRVAAWMCPQCGLHVVARLAGPPQRGRGWADPAGGRA